MPKIELTNEEAELFKKFRKYQDEVEFLIERGVFDIKGEGSVSLHYDPQGKLRSVKVNRAYFYRG